MTLMRPLDPTGWRLDRSGEFYAQQNDAARIVKVRTGRKVTGWILYINGEFRGQWPSLTQAKRNALDLTEITS